MDYWIIQYVFFQHKDDAKWFSKVIRALDSLQVIYKSSHNATFLLKLGLVHLFNFRYSSEFGLFCSEFNLYLLDY